MEIRAVPRLYLAGPIHGCTDRECLDWRKRVFQLYPESIDPMRRDYRGIEDENVKDIVELDKRDILDCDVVLANCPIPSAGTSMEILYAHQNHKPVVTVVPYLAKVSPWISYHSTAVVDFISLAFDYIDSISCECHKCGNTYLGVPKPKCGCYNTSYKTYLGAKNEDNA